jgi:hypothetical protein
MIWKKLDGAIEIEVRQSDRLKKVVRKPECYALLTKQVNGSSIKSVGQRQGLEQSKLEEIELVFKDLKTMEPVRRE